MELIIIEKNEEINLTLEKLNATQKIKDDIKTELFGQDIHEKLSYN